jgi:hypothetical protein
MRRALLWWSSLMSLLLLTCLDSVPARAANVSGYTRDIPPETPTARKLRHERVAERRAGTILLAHRGACTLAPENTLEAYAAAMDYGADGCEVDVRRTADGVFVLFHDDMLDHLTDGFGEVEDLSYTDLLALRPQQTHGVATRLPRPPTFAALVVLARQRAMLLHLDVKRPGLDDVIARILDETDLWDHVVAINTETLPKLLTHPKLKLLRYKGPLYESRRDVDPDAHPGGSAPDRPRIEARSLPTRSPACRGLFRLDSDTFAVPFHSDEPCSDGPFAPAAKAHRPAIHR